MKHVHAAKLYAAIADGQSIEVADRVGRVALELSDVPGHELPRLVCAEDVDASTTWLVQVFAQ